MKSYVKIHGPLLLKVIKALEEIALDTLQSALMDTMVASSGRVDILG